MQSSKISSRYATTLIYNIADCIFCNGYYSQKASGDLPVGATPVLESVNLAGEGAFCAH